MFDNKKQKDISTKTSIESGSGDSNKMPEAINANAKATKASEVGPEPRGSENTAVAAAVPVKAPVKGKPSSGKKSPVLAALLGLLVPGLGFIYTGLILHGIVVFLFSCIFVSIVLKLVFIHTGFVMQWNAILLFSWLTIPYLYGIFSAFVTAKKINRGEPYGAKLGLFVSMLSGALVSALLVHFVIISTVIPMIIATENTLVKSVKNEIESAMKAMGSVVSRGENAETAQKPVESADEPKEEPVPESEGVFDGGGEVPVYPGMEMLGIKMGDNYMGHKFAVKATLKNVVIFYKTRLVETGYKLYSSDYKEGTEKTTLSFSRKGIECKIDLNKNENGNTTTGLISIIQ